MITNAAPKMRLLLLKSEGQFKHSGKYFLHQGRWHKLHQDKPAPKGAAIAAHPHAAGAPVAKPTYTDEQWEQLKLPAENSNASTFNKQIDQLKAAADAGDVTGILGSGYGTNTYGKKLSIIANHVLGLLGSTHTVTPGQKPGAHAAVQTAPEIEAGKPAPVESPAAATPPSAQATPLSSPAKPDADPFPTFADHDAADAATDANPEDASPEPASQALSMPAFQEGKTVTGVIAYYEKVGQKVLDLAVAGDTAGLEAMKADGLKPNSKGKVSNTWAGKTPNSKLLLALHAQALEQAKGVTPANEGDTAQAVENKDEALQAAVDHLQEDVQQDNLPAAEKKEDAELVQKLEAAQGDQKPVKKESPASSEDSAQPAAAEPAPIKKEPRLVIPKKAPAAAPATGTGGKLDQIPWDALQLPDSNTNAASVNKKLAAIKQAAYAGDVAALEAMTFGKNTYNKKLALVAQTAIAALKEGGAPAFDPAAPAQAAEPSLADTFATMAKKEQYTQIESIAKEKIKADPAGKADVIAALDAAGLKGLAKMVDKETPVAAAQQSGAMPAEVKAIVDNVAAHGNQLALQEIINTSTNDVAVSYAKEKLSELQGKAADTGPNEGDTKQGADGMLVFKNGRWHKQAEAKSADPSPAAQPAPTGVDAVQVPDFANISPGKWGVAYKKVAEYLKQLVVAGGVEALKGVVINHQDGSFTIKAAGYNLKKVGPEGLSGDLLANARRKAMHQFVTELKAAAGKPKKASKPKAASAPKPDSAPAPSAAPSIEPMDTWTQTGPQGGSNPGGRFKDPDGVEWYCKFPADEDTAKAEVLAAKLYAALGISGQDAKLITKGGKVGIASKWVSVSKASSPAALAKVDGVASGFGADAWLGNWDVVGLAYDNLQIGADGKAHRVDAGGSLMYRAQGGKKAFGNIVTEIDSLRDPKINPQAAAVFGGMTDADITASVAKVVMLPDASIRAICYQHGPGSEADRKALAETLIARKNDLAAKFPKAGKAKKKRLDPTSLPVDPSQLPKRHDFSNWNGPGKGLSSQPHVNAANAAVEQEVIELAKTGNLTKLKDFHFHEIDKATGNATGKLVPIKNHPSKHVVQFHADVVQLLDEIANPPEPLKIFAETDVPTLDALAAAFPPKPFGTTVDSVKSNEKLGFWVVLGGASGVEKFKPKKVMDYTPAAIQAAHQKYKDAKPLAKHFINSVQASGSYNDLFRNGKETDGHGNKLTDVAKAALEQATEMPEGTSVYRWQNMSDDMVKKIMSAPDGTVFQATGPMCTSYSPTATAGFGQHRVTIRYAKGAKAVESFGSKAFKGEKEVTTLPNSRFVILSKKMVPNEKNPGKQRLELEVLMLPPDLGIAP